MKEALFYQPLDKNKVQCSLCPHNCIITNHKTGFCRVRKNIDEKLYSLVYGKPVARSLDPIEKKPLFHFLPGSTTYSIATIGCNMTCKHCQNFSISQASLEQISNEEVSVKEIVKSAVQMGASSISYTYTEPTVFYEYVLDIAKYAKAQGLKNILVTNGYINREPLEDLLDYIDAANIDLKGMNEGFYKSICGASLQPVLDSINLFYSHSTWIEITTLLIPDHNDDSKELRRIAEFIFNIDQAIPWHVSSFYPHYKLLDAKPTSMASLNNAVSIGIKAGLKYVYQGNTRRGEDTYCPDCGKLLVKRTGFHIEKNDINQGLCKYCQSKIKGVFK